MLLGDLQLAGDELPREADRVALEVVAEREVAEHLEERVVPRGVPDLLEIVVLAAGAHALLRGRRPPAELGLLQSEKHALELHHPRVREQQRRIVRGHQRGAGADGMALALEIAEEPAADVVRGQCRWHESNIKRLAISG